MKLSRTWVRRLAKNDDTLVCLLEERLVGFAAEIPVDRDRVGLHAFKRESYISDVGRADVPALVVEDENDIWEVITDVEAHPFKQIQSEGAVPLEEGNVGLERKRKIARSVDDHPAELADPLDISVQGDRRRGSRKIVDSYRNPLELRVNAHADELALRPLGFELFEKHAHEEPPISALVARRWLFYLFLIDPGVTLLPCFRGLNQELF